MDKFPVHTLTPLLILLTYLSAYKDGKLTCDRYLINSSLYLITSISIFFTGLKTIHDQNIQLEKKHKAGFGLLLLVLVFSLSFVKNNTIRHLMWFLILVLFSLILNYEKYDKELIEDTFKKMLLIVLLCVLIAIQFPQYIKPKMGTILIFGLLFVLVFRIIDTFFFNKKYNTLISSIAVFIFSAFIIYDTDRIMKDAKECVKSKNPDYLNNMINMFLNLMNLFNNLIVMVEE